MRQREFSLWSVWWVLKLGPVKNRKLPFRWKYCQLQETPVSHYLFLHHRGTESDVFNACVCVWCDYLVKSQLTTWSAVKLMYPGRIRKSLKDKEFRFTICSTIITKTLHIYKSCLCLSCLLTIENYKLVSYTFSSSEIERYLGRSLTQRTAGGYTANITFLGILSVSFHMNKSTSTLWWESSAWVKQIRVIQGKTCSNVTIQHQLHLT